jgi:RNA polymerase sigma-70 factor (ECF subfamily)
MDLTAVRARLMAAHSESFTWALNCCGRDRTEAEEVMQMVYLKVLEGRARFDGRSAFTTWLFAVIRRTAAEERRRRRRDGARVAPLERESTVRARGPQPDEAMLGAERRALLARTLARLPARQREVLWLVFYHDRTIEEAAAIMGVGLGSARRHYARGKERLREILPAMEEVWGA